MVDTVRYVRQRQSEGAANATINRELQLLQQATGQRFRKLPEHNTRRGFFTEEEVAALIDALPHWLKAPVQFAALTGWRRGEVFGLTWDNVTDDAVVLYPEQAKEGKSRFVPRTGRIETIMQTAWGTRIGPFVFHHRGKRITDFRKAWKTACKKAGLENRLFHDLRRSAVRNMLRRGVPEKVVMAITGHRTRYTFDRYNIIDHTDIRRAFDDV